MQSASLSAVSMLREAVNLSPNARLMPASASDAGSSDSEPDTSAAALHTCDFAQEEPAGKGEEQQQHQQQRPQQQQQGHGQGQEAGRGEVMMREAYKEMLLQQQSRYRSELERRQAKHQRQLDTQVQQGHIQTDSSFKLLERTRQSVTSDFCSAVAYNHLLHVACNFGCSHHDTVGWHVLCWLQSCHGHECCTCRGP